MKAESPADGASLRIVSVGPSLTRQAVRFFHDRLEDTFAETFPPEAIADYREEYSPEQVDEKVRRDDCLVLAAVEDGEVLGTMFGSGLKGGLAYVEWIVVHPEAQGLGIGRALMEETFARYAELGAHKVALYTETLDAREFYESVGMELEGTHPNHWWGLTHYCLGRELDSETDSGPNPS